MVIGFTFFTIMNYNVDRALKKANKYINDPTNVSEYSEAQQLDSALKISDRIFRLEGGKLARLDPNDHIRVHFDGLFDAV